jgi:hypothetical protein
LNKLELPSPKDNLYQVWSNLLFGSRIEDFLKCSAYFYSFAIISPSRGAITFIWTNLNFLPQRWFVPSVVKIGLVVLEKKILKKFQSIFTFSLLSPLGVGISLSFEQTWIPST